MPGRELADVDQAKLASDSNLPIIPDSTQPPPNGDAPEHYQGAGNKSTQAQAPANGADQPGVNGHKRDDVHGDVGSKDEAGQGQPVAGPSVQVTPATPARKTSVGRESVRSVRKGAAAPPAFHPQTPSIDMARAQSRTRKDESAAGAGADQQDAGSRSGTTKSRITTRILGDYTLSRTLGAGSMGKVKLAHHNVTGERYAVKIIPRAAPSGAEPQPSSEAGASSKRSRDIPKEIRTLREAALSMLLHHPYICGMREMIVHVHHYYMVVEYVDGGQMLDYIIAHGRLRERVARKFSRQICSALEYLHKNNVVHRDLKIENILISQTGNIRLIDFGLSNLYDPTSHLATFCGSPYFAAPELLSAKIYTGPEVDVWSFGVVLYVLVCGRVPFDDQSMPALHAKIKRGLVEYPNWLSAECRHILSRMLVTNPIARAPLSEVKQHVWLNRGSSAPPDPHVYAHREPIRVHDVDPAVIRGMDGFDFGTEDEIGRKLIEVLESDAYLRAVGNWERVNGRVGKNRSRSSSTLLSDHSNGGHDSGSTLRSPSRSPSGTKKRFSTGLDWARKKLPFASMPTSPPGSPISSSTPAANSQSFSGSHAQQPVPPLRVLTDAAPRDPCFGFHPLVSMYHLAREKLEREKLYGPGIFASSQLSLPTAAHEASAVAVAQGAGQAHSLPAVNTQSKLNGHSTAAKAEYSAPAAETPVSRAQPNPESAPGSSQSQPRSRDYATVNNSALPAPPPDIPEKDRTVKHRRSHSLGSPTAHIQDQGKTHGDDQEHATIRGRAQRPSQLSPSSEKPLPAPDRVDTNVLKEKPSKSASQEKAATPIERGRPPSVDDRASPITAGASLVRKFGSLLGGKNNGSTRYGSSRRRGSVLPAIDASVPPPSSFKEDPIGSPTANGLEPDGNKEKENEKVRSTSMDEIRKPAHPSASDDQNPEAGNRRVSAVEMETSQSYTAGVGARGPLHRRAATIMDPQGRAARHSRRLSASSAFMRTGTIGRHTRRPQTAQSADIAGGTFVGRRNVTANAAEEQVETDRNQTLRPRRNGAQPREAEGEAEGELTETETARDVQSEDENKEFKPVFLKGLFSVATTSTKPSATIRTDIRRVLERMQVRYRETKTGFECVYIPSIDTSAVQEADQQNGSEPNAALALPTGEVSQDVLDSVGSKAMAVRFDINVVKVPMVPLRGIQFRRAAGDGWQYHMLARRVLTELKL